MVVVRLLKTNRLKFTINLDPLYGDACVAKSFKVLPRIFSTEFGPIYFLQSVLKITRFENVFFFIFPQDQAKIKRSTPKIHPPKPETGTSEVLFVPGYNRLEGGWNK